MSTRTQISAANQTIIGSDMNSLPNGSAVISASAITLTATGYPRADAELVVGFGSAPTVNTTVLGWYIKTVDGGTNYEDGSSSIIPLKKPDLIFTLKTGTSQRIIIPCVLPVGLFKVLVQNNSGQAFNSTGNTIRILPITDQNA